MSKRLLFFAFFTAAFFSACTAKPVRIEGTAMKPNYNDGDLILFEKNFSNLKRGDLITFLFPKDRSKWYFKGVIGLPGEAVEIKEGKILIDGQSLEEQYVDARFNQQKQNFPWRKIETEAYSSSATTAIIPPTRAIGERLTPS